MLHVWSLVSYISLFTFFYEVHAQSHKDESVDDRFKRLESYIMEQSFKLQEQGQHMKGLTLQLQEQNRLIKEQSEHLTEQTRLIQNQSLKLIEQAEQMESMKTLIAAQKEETELKVAAILESSRLQNDKISILNDMLRTYPNSEITRQYEPTAYVPHNNQVRNKGYTIHSISKDVPLERSGRLLIPSSTSPPALPVNTAFYAHMSKRETAPGQHHTLIFDVLKTNVNGGYSSFTGVFTVPLDDVYVFTFTIRMGCRAYGSFEILKNADVVGLFYDEQNDDCENSNLTGVVVITAKKGDMVYLRTHSSHAFSGNIESDGSGWSTFSGWAI